MSVLLAECPHSLPPKVLGDFFLGYFMTDAPPCLSVASVASLSHYSTLVPRKKIKRKKQQGLMKAVWRKRYYLFRKDTASYLRPLWTVGELQWAMTRGVVQWIEILNVDHINLFNTSKLKDWQKKMQKHDCVITGQMYYCLFSSVKNGIYTLKKTSLILWQTDILMGLCCLMCTKTEDDVLDDSWQLMHKNFKSHTFKTRRCHRIKNIIFKTHALQCHCDPRLNHKDIVNTI